MKCAQCQSENPSDTRFCQNCGGQLASHALTGSARIGVETVSRRGSNRRLVVILGIGTVLLVFAACLFFSFMVFLGGVASQKGGIPAKPHSPKMDSSSILPDKPWPPYDPNFKVPTGKYTGITIDDLASLVRKSQDAHILVKLDYDYCYVRSDLWNPLSLDQKKNLSSVFGDFEALEYEEIEKGEPKYLLNIYDSKTGDVLAQWYKGKITIN